MRGFAQRVLARIMPIVFLDEEMRLLIARRENCRRKKNEIVQKECGTKKRDECIKRRPLSPNCLKDEAGQGGTAAK